MIAELGFAERLLWTKNILPDVDGSFNYIRLEK